jgi:signal transduction histidine kinase
MLGTAFHLSLLPVILPVVIVQATALWWRRTYPLAVLVVVLAAGLVWWLAVPSREPGSPAVVFAVYAVSVYGGSRARMWVVGVMIAMVAAAIALLLLGDFPVTRDLLPAAASSLVAWVIGDYIRSRRQFFADLVARNKQEREQAAEEERLRIARELHDVVAHNVSAIAIQAGAARVSGSNGSEAAEALESIERGARDTLAELNKLLGVLRKGSAPLLAPQPTLAEVGSLLKPARDAGLDATMKVTGARRPLPAALELSAYRIVQESITNVLKHANATRVEVTLDYRPDSIGLTISDNGSGDGQHGDRTGHGLIGMRERVGLFGGDLTTGSSSLGGFTVRATLPVKS